MNCNEINAHLIAAAPELLEALKRVMGILEISDVFIEAMKYNNAGKTATLESLRSARAAIAKAEGVDSNAQA